ncbi:hypothetical protein CC80DRAFT_487853 [Byssothecium circinans]|uniref:Uncharacterized protein n=1 Tax=Byssothecium circinans TaxID=147558 RepID=A0A6A5UHH2_9PLEO|nr:hypothetical protein CC80DRAFT_487853 [Byssothecium circinans]
MDKVWFKLRQTHYPPGPEDVILAGDGNDTAASICLGHCITGLKRLDFPLNRGEVLAFPTRMKVFRASSLEFKWHDEQRSNHGVKLGIGAPVAAALGLLSVQGSVKLAFRHSRADYEMYDRLDTYFVQPTPAYVEDCLDGEALRKYIAGKSNWSFFLITGIRVARKGSKKTEETRSREVEGGPQA